jgi:hypothetical protein
VEVADQPDGGDGGVAGRSTRPGRAWARGGAGACQQEGGEVGGGALGDVVDADKGRAVLDGVEGGPDTSAG